MVNKTLLPPAITPRKTSNSLKNRIFQLARLSLSNRWTAAWESLAVREIGRHAWESSARSMKGRTTDGEYASRRTIAADGAGTADRCRRQQRRQHQHHRLQGRRSLFEEYLTLGRARRQFPAPPTAASPSCRTARPSTISRRRHRADQEPARRRHRRQRLPRRADPGRRALHPRRLLADQHSGPARHRRRPPRARHLRPDRVPADRQGHQIAADGNVTVLEGTDRIDSVRGKLRLVTSPTRRSS